MRLIDGGTKDRGDNEEATLRENGGIRNANDRDSNCLISSDTTGDRTPRITPTRMVMVIGATTIDIILTISVSRTAPPFSLIKDSIPIEWIIAK